MLYNLKKNFFKRFYVFIHKRHTRLGGAAEQRHRQREKQAPCREPDVGLNSRTPGSHPRAKADAVPLSYAGIPHYLFLKALLILMFYYSVIKVALGSLFHDLNSLIWCFLNGQSCFTALIRIIVASLLG